MRSLFQRYEKVSAPVLSYAQSAFLLWVRLYWGWQFTRTGMGKLRHLDRITEYFRSLGVPHPAFTSHFVGGLELVGGTLLIAGLASRLISLPLTISMFNAYWFGDHQALLSLLSHPGKFYGADPYTFLFASLLILIFGPGLFSLDAMMRRILLTQPKKARSVTA